MAVAIQAHAQLWQSGGIRSLCLSLGLPGIRFAKCDQKTKFNFVKKKFWGFDVCFHFILKWKTQSSFVFSCHKAKRETPEQPTVQWSLGWARGGQAPLLATGQSSLGLSSSCPPSLHAEFPSCLWKTCPLWVLTKPMWLEKNLWKQVTFSDQ